MANDSRPPSPLHPGPRTGEPPYKFGRASTDAHVRCDIVDEGLKGATLRIFVRDHLLMTYHFESANLAARWAKEMETDLENG